MANGDSLARDKWLCLTPIKDKINIWIKDDRSFHCQLSNTLKTSGQAISKHYEIIQVKTLHYVFKWWQFLKTT